jgi:hypothetical protein
MDDDRGEYRQQVYFGFAFWSNARLVVNAADKTTTEAQRHRGCTEKSVSSLGASSVSLCLCG